MSEQSGGERPRPDPAALRDAATILLTRRGPSGPEVLMGQRGAGAAFMPNKFVFPGGAVDPADRAIPLIRPIGPTCRRRLELPGAPSPETIAAAAIRELWEETGLALAAPGRWEAPPPAWRAIAGRGLVPSAAPLRYVFRAITPPGRPRRFDARFFLADAADLVGDPDDFSLASDELAHLQWVPVARARSFDLPFITEVVLAEVMRIAGLPDAPASVPFFDNSGPVPTFRRLF